LLASYVDEPASVNTPHKWTAVRMRPPKKGFATVGSVAGVIAGSEPQVAALTNAALSDDPAMNTHAALLNRINVASACSLASQHDANKLLSVIAHAEAVTLKAKRERYADAINIDIYLRKNFKRIGSGVPKEQMRILNPSGFLISLSSEQRGNAASSRTFEAEKPDRQKYDAGVRRVVPCDSAASQRSKPQESEPRRSRENIRRLLCLGNPERQNADEGASLRRKGMEA
jgi:hypothetical protein